ncbi:hypothetical protein BZG36_01154 [Bifiguratus adelaidae]|uniref:PPPDE domain-containing protein n=1 Tax=Bifiguratus adelaidae TaxID=1938954 RepID=A0A261Y5U4_9FUNG|nr:hypothetical protein BZG36_01154 [Bifiguratus adelaidae]
MGYTPMSREEVMAAVKELSQEYAGNSYNLLTRNCNHFSEELCFRLTGKHAPQWMNRAAKLAAMFPCVVPSEWVEPPEFQDEDDAFMVTPSSTSAEAHMAPP